jgi:mono/diheme cytochrome c family protein
MSEMTDLLLKKPLTNEVLRGLLFGTFALHLLFVLLTIGTAVISFSHFVHALWRGKIQELRWDREILKTFFGQKSLAAVLGVAPLLLIQVGFSVPFFTAVNLFAPFWMLIIPLLIISFLTFDYLGHRMNTRPYAHLVAGTVSLLFLLAVPGIFVAVLLTVEDPGSWVSVIRDGYRLRGDLAFHWLFRYLHVLGAALVFGAVFHYFFTSKEDKEKKRHLTHWLVTGMLLQFVIGALLLFSLPGRPHGIVLVFTSIGAMAGVLMLLYVFQKAYRKGSLGMGTTIPLMAVLFVFMLLGRHFIQELRLLPFQKVLEVNASAYQDKLRPYERQALDNYLSSLKVSVHSGEWLYQQSCAFCHGENADGMGEEAGNLTIPPEDLTAVRTTRNQLRRIYSEGIDGSAMPYFTVFDREKLESLTDYLHNLYHILDAPGPIPVQISAKLVEEANKQYAGTCAGCHGLDGRGTRLSRSFKPSPPDFTQYSLTPQRAFTVITNGYPGTMMPPFRTLQEEVRWGLVKVVNDKRKQ